jgi:phosphoribosyl 1,2-cyclic phosphodiesterase
MKPQKLESSPSHQKKESFQLLFLGTGASTAVPELGHVLRKTCKICAEAWENPNSKNNRNNVSVAILFYSKDGLSRCVMIDCGKTMRNATLKSFTKNSIAAVDGLILTHGHADAMLGLISN